MNHSRPTSKETGHWPGTAGFWARGETSVSVRKAALAHSRAVGARGPGVKTTNLSIAAHRPCDLSTRLCPVGTVWETSRALVRTE